jgi:hypothetical protein
MTSTTRPRRSSRRWAEAQMAWLAAIFSASLAVLPQGGDARLGAFQSLCMPDRLDLTATKHRLTSAGWEEVAPSSHPELAGVMALNDAAARVNDSESETTIYRGAFNAIPLFITVNRLTAEISSTETARYGTCAVWDFDGDAPIPDDEVTAWIAVPAQVRVDMPNLARSVLWPLQDKLPGAANLRASYIAANSPAAAQAAYDGTSIFLTSDLDARQ